MTKSGFDILVVAFSAFPDESATSNHICRICRGLQLQGWSPIVMGVAPDRFHLRGNFSRWQISYENVWASVPRIPLFKLLLGRRIGELWRILLRRLLQKGTFRAVLFYGSSYLAFKPLLDIFKLYGIPVVSYEIEYPERNWMTLLSGQYYEHIFYIRKIIPKVSGIIAISSFWKKFADTCTIPSIIIPSYLSDEIEKIKIACRPCRPEKDNFFHLVSLGSWFPRECPTTVLRAVKMTCQSGIPIRYTAIGRVGYNPLEYEALNMYRRDPVLRQAVNLTGWLDSEEKDRILASADAFVLLRKQSIVTMGLFPTRLPEYLAYARPLIVSMAGDLPLYLSHRENAWIIPDSNHPKALRDAIIALHENRELADSIGMAGFVRAKRSFSIEKNGSNMSIFINDIILMQSQKVQF